MEKKNPFVNCKSQKRKSKKIIKPYCPLSMVRYDGLNNGYQTMWACKICSVYCLSENAATQHSSKCRVETPVSKGSPLETMVYTCSVCGVILNRQVKLKKHMEIHGNVKINTVVTKNKTTQKQTGNNIVRTEQGLTKHIKIRTESATSIPSTSKYVPY